MGPAGSGKTHALIAEIEKLTIGTTLPRESGVLAITFMHGARRRLEVRLRHLRKKGLSVQCETIDSFCLRIVNRFRRYLGKTRPISVQLGVSDEVWIDGDRETRASITAIRRAAVKVLACSCVSHAIGKSYPIIVVDEFQDCDHDLLAIVSQLWTMSNLLVAADDFQHLSSDPDCPAVAWLNERNAETVILEGNKRTNISKLIESALALRSGTKAPDSIDLMPIAPGIAAWEISSRIAWNKIPFGKSKVIISPVRPASAPWLKSVLESLERELGKQKKIGPYPFRWEGSEQEELKEMSADIISNIGEAQTVSKAFLADLSHSKDAVVRAAAVRGLRLLSLRGVQDLTVEEFLDILGRSSHSAFAFRRERDHARLAISVHGAKNREFDYVFIAWPYQVSGNDLFKRKLLYNAITRARVEAVLFVQGDAKRIENDPVLSLLHVGLKQTTANKPKRLKTPKQ